MRLEPRNGGHRIGEGRAYETEALLEEIEPALGADLEQVQGRFSDGRSPVGTFEKGIEDTDDRAPIEQPRVAAGAFEAHAPIPDEEDEFCRLALGEETLAGFHVFFLDDGGYPVDDPGLQVVGPTRKHGQEQLTGRAKKPWIRHVAVGVGGTLKAPGKSPR